MILAEAQRALCLAAPLPYDLLFQHRTIRSLAQAIARLGAAGAPGGAGIARRDWGDCPRRQLSANQQQMWVLRTMGLDAAYNMQVRSWQVPGSVVCGQGCLRAKTHVGLGMRQSIWEDDGVEMSQSIALWICWFPVKAPGRFAWLFTLVST